MKHRHIIANGITLHVVELGEGPGVLFVHGFPDTWRGWRMQMEAVAAAGKRAIALDMRGYGESSAPSDPALYTPLYTVGDLIGLLDALDLRTVTVVGHDFGASVAWNAAMMRPDRFSAVFCLSVPYLPPGGPSFLQQLRDGGMEKNFYMFQQMRPEAEQEWADAETTIPGAFYWTSASAHANERWDPFDPSHGLTRLSPVGIPNFVNSADMKAAIAEFQRNGFRGPLNYYRAIDPYFAMAGAFAGASIRQPSFFMNGSADGLNKLLEVTEEQLRPGLPGLCGFVTLEQVGHWPQLEAAHAVNEALLRFIAAPD